MINMVTRLGARTLELINRLGEFGLFFLQVLMVCGKALTRPRLIVKQLYHVGVQTFSIIAVAGLFVGMVLGLQMYYNFVKFGATSSLGLVVALSLTRELGPVLTALLFAGRAGSALTAEIGLMKTTQQFAAMEMMAIDPLRVVIAPRFWAGLIAVPLLAMIFTSIGILGAYVIGVMQLGLDSGVFWNSMQKGVDFNHDVLSGIIKSIVFGVVMIWIALYQGYYATPTSEGVSKATTQTVVTSCLTVLGLDYILTAIMFGV